MSLNLDAAVTSFHTWSKKNLFASWFIHENPREITSLLAEQGCPSPKNQILTLKEFAKTVVKKCRPDCKFLDTDIQFVKFLEIASKSPLKNSDFPLPLNLIKAIITVYTFTGNYGVTIPDESRKHKIIRDIIEEYQTWCRENNYLDQITIHTTAAELLKNHEFPAEMIFISGDAQTIPIYKNLYEAVETCPHEKFTTEISTRPEITCLQYRTAKSEILATMDRIARLIESGVKPEDILILTPSIPTTEPLIREFAPDFYTKTDDGIQPLKFRCAESGPTLASIPEISVLVSILSAVTTDYPLTDLEHIVASPALPGRPTKKLTAGMLHLIAELAEATEGKEIFAGLEERAAQEGDFATFEPEIKELSDVIRWLEPLETAGTTFGEITDTFLEWIDKSGWPNKPAGNGKRACGNFLDLIRKLRSTVIRDIKCTLPRYFSFIQHLADDNTVKILNKDAVEVSSIRNASFTQADYVFIVNMTAEKIPKVDATLPPFTELETDALIPEMKEIMYRREELYMQKAMQTAQKELILSYAEKNRGTAHSPSGFLTRLGGRKTVTAPDFLHEISRNQILAGKLLRDGGQIPENTVGLTDGYDVYTRARDLQDKKLLTFDFSCSQEYLDQQKQLTTSPTAIERYLNCPLDWMLSKHLKLYTPFKNASEGQKTGLAVHEALKEFFSIYTKQITEETLAEAEETLFRLVEEKMDAMNIRTPTWDAAKIRYLGKEGFTSPLKEFLKKEQELQRDGWKTTGDMVEYSFDQKLEHDGNTIALKGYIDRIVTRGDEYQIIDYKTGSSFTYQPETTVQIPLYAQAYRELTDKTPVDGMYFKMDPNGRKKFEPIRVTERTVEKKKTSLSVDSVIEEALDLCTEAINGMKTGKCSPPVKCPNKNCSFRLLCSRMQFTQKEESE